jgi:hypothetical protein
VEADYLLVWPPITEEELVTSLASLVGFYKQVRFNAVLHRKYIVNLHVAGGCREIEVCAVSEKCTCR